MAAPGRRAPDARAVLEPAVGGERVVDGQDRRRAAVSTRPAAAARRAARWLSATTSQRLAEVVHRPGSSGSSCAAGETSLAKGRSAAVSTAATPGAARTAARSSAVIRPARPGRQPEGQVQAVGGHGDVVDVARLAGDVQVRGVVGQGARRRSWRHLQHAGGVAGVRRRAPDSAAACCAPPHPVAGRGAHVVDRGEVVRPGRSAAATCRLGPGLADQRRLDRAARLGMAAMPPKAMRAAVTVPSVDGDVESSRRPPRCPGRTVWTACSSAAGRAGAGS